MAEEIADNRIDFIQLVEYSLNAITVVEDSIVVYANRAMLELLSLSTIDEITGKNFRTYLHPDFHNICKDRLHRVTHFDEIAELMEQKMIRSDGTFIDVEVMAAPYKLEGKKMAQVIVQDITKVKKTEKLLIQSEKLSLIGELAAGIVHEIRNPLTSIKGFLQLMLSNENEFSEYLKIVKGEVDRIEEISNDLLFFSKPKSKQLKQENIIDITKDVMYLLENQAFMKGVKLEYFFEEEYLYCKVDKSQLKQVILNIVKNAIEATPKAGFISVKISRVDCNIYIKITDSGIGIPKDKLKNIGQSFFTTKEKGTGLGLMVSYNIIKNHKGNIEVESMIGKGTTFTIELPLIK